MRVVNAYCNADAETKRKVRDILGVNLPQKVVASRDRNAANVTAGA